MSAPDNIQRDIVFPLPYDIAAMDPEERRKRTKIDADLCAIDRNRFFIRGVLEIPVHGSDEPFRFGLWAEVERATVMRYMQIYRADAREEPPRAGMLANTMRGYPSALGHHLQVHFGTAKDRPRFVLEASDHPLALEQRDGVDLERLEALVHRALSRAAH